MENVDVERGGNIDVVENTLQGLLDCVEKNESFTNKFSPSIYMAHSTLRDLSPSSFNPRVVSIGPLHSKDENVQAFEGHKAKYVHDLLQRVKSQRPEQTLEACAQKVAASIEQIKGCYAGIEAYDDTEIAKMMVMDACFILGFIYWCTESDEAKQGNMLLAQFIIYDLVLLENQIPFFVLKDIFLCTVKKFEPDMSIIDLILPVLMSLNLFESRIKISNANINPMAAHILGLLHQCYQPRKYIRSYFYSSKIHSAIELNRAGVSFKPNRDARCPMAMEVKISWTSCFPWSLGKPTITMPILRVHHFTGLIFRNIIAYEQSFVGNDYGTLYAIAMNMLIDTQEDVAKLVESKVLVNNIGSNEEAANMMNNICKDVAWVHCGPEGHWKELDAYCNSCWPKFKAGLRRTYFTTPWSSVAVIAGMVLFALTVIQTFFTIMPPGNSN